MSRKAAHRYAENETMTAVMGGDARELIVLIHQRIFELERGQLGIEYFIKATDLIQQGLLGCLDYEKGKDVAHNLSAIYVWSMQELLSARVARSPERVQDVMNTLTPLYEAWVELSPNSVSLSQAS
jgi:flagellar secretion chaperone FliS